MGIQQYHMRIRTVIDHRLQDRRNTARFSRSGRADNAEMFAKKLIDQNVSWYGNILVDGADRSRRGYRASFPCSR